MIHNETDFLKTDEFLKTDTEEHDLAFDGIDFNEAEQSWSRACERFLQAVSPAQRPAVERLFQGLHTGGAGLREWISAILRSRAVLPSRIPEEIVDVYLADPEAIPLHDCEGCGLATPVRPNRLRGQDAEPEVVYFPTCPLCGGRTGWYFYCSRQVEGERFSATLERRRPR